MTHKIFIDGEVGTTGLEIKKRLSERKELEIISIDDNMRKDRAERFEYYNEADLVFQCLPDEESKAMIKDIGPVGTRIIDASTAHRINDDWTYGLPELCEAQREQIKGSDKVSNPGCHATGYILLMRPLFDAGIIGENINICAHSITGYSGGGKSMIANYESMNEQQIDIHAPGQYGLSQNHKHLPEMVKYGSVAVTPVFTPIVGDFYRGMLVSVQMHTSMYKRRTGIKEMMNIYKERYADNSLISVKSEGDVAENGFIYADRLKSRDDLEIIICGNDERMTLMARFDNLGKGASGAAIQNMNIMLDLPEYSGLEIEKTER